MEVYTVFANVIQYLDFRQAMKLGIVSRDLRANYLSVKSRIYMDLMKKYKGVSHSTAEILFKNLYKNRMKISFEKGVWARPLFFCKFLVANGASGRYCDLLLTIQDKNVPKLLWILEEHVPKTELERAKNFARHYGMQHFFN